MIEKRLQRSDRFKRLRRHYTSRIVERIDRIEHELLGRRSDGPSYSEAKGRADGAGAADEPDMPEIYRIVHKLGGSAGTFGYPGISERSQALEGDLLAAMDGGTVDSEQLVERIRRYCRETRRLIRERQQAEQAEQEEAEAGALDASSERDEKIIFIFDEDADLGSELVSQLKAYGYEVTLYRDPGNLLEAVERRRPDAVLMDVVFTTGRRAGIEATEKLRESSFSDIPVIFVSSSAGMRTRLRAVRAGGEDYFVKPVDASLLAERISEMTRQAEQLTGHILLVDDDRLLSEYLARVLRENGFEVTVLHDPMQVLDTLKDTPPDLLLLDLYLPDYTGDELAAVLRQHEIDIGIPIVFISTESSHKRRTRALMRGGDDFLFKPIDPEALVDTCRFHLFRSQRIRRRIHIDGLTRLFNHAYLKERLEREVDMSGRSHSTVSLAMVDLDDFKDVNDQWGHQVGDAVLRMLANLLSNRLRSTDIVGRYGGEEFAVILPETDADGAWQVMEELRQSFGELEYRVEGQAVGTTFTYGIASSHDARISADTLWRQADQALYRGKRMGKNRGMIADETG